MSYKSTCRRWIDAPSPESEVEMLEAVPQPPVGCHPPRRFELFWIREHIWITHDGPVKRSECRSLVHFGVYPYQTIPDTAAPVGMT